MSNENQEQLIYDLVDGQLSADEIVRAQQLIAENEEWAQLYKELREQQSALRKMPRFRLDESFADRVLAKANEQGAFDSCSPTVSSQTADSLPSPAWSFTRWRAPMAAIVSVAALLLVAIFVYPNIGPRESAKLESNTIVEERRDDKDSEEAENQDGVSANENDEAKDLTRLENAIGEKAGNFKSLTESASESNEEAMKKEKQFRQQPRDKQNELSPGRGAMVGADSEQPKRNKLGEDHFDNDQVGNKESGQNSPKGGIGQLADSTRQRRNLPTPEMEANGAKPQLDSIEMEMIAPGTSNAASEDIAMALEKMRNGVQLKKSANGPISVSRVILIDLPDDEESRELANQAFRDNEIDIKLAARADSNRGASPNQALNQQGQQENSQQQEGMEEAVPQSANLSVQPENGAYRLQVSPNNLEKAFAQLSERAEILVVNPNNENANSYFRADEAKMQLAELDEQQKGLGGADDGFGAGSDPNVRGGGGFGGAGFGGGGGSIKVDQTDIQKINQRFLLADDDDPTAVQNYTLIIQFSDRTGAATIAGRKDGAKASDETDTNSDVAPPTEAKSEDDN